VPHFDFTIDITRPPKDVFALLTDIDRLPEWQTSAVSATVDGELKAGATIGLQRRFMGRDVAAKDEVTVYEPPRRFDVKSRSGSPAPYEIHHTLEPSNGGTRLRVEADVKLGTMMRVAARPMLKAAEREFQSDFERLKELIEACQ
jgi:carbon monoxide dehydrogenase subunit G